MGSTALYDRVGDLAAFDLVRHHFSALLTAVAAEGGAVVKTIGDAVMATFPAPDRAIRAAMQMRKEMRKINDTRGNQDLALNIGLHEGPRLAVTLNDRQDYFGQTVNIASRVQGLADPTAILATQPIVENAEAARLVSGGDYKTTSRQMSLRGVSRSLHDLRDSRAGACGRGGVRDRERPNFSSRTSRVICRIQLAKRGAGKVDCRSHNAVREWPLFACAVRRRRFPVGASPTRRTLQPEATGAVMEVTKWLKPSV